MSKEIENLVKILSIKFPKQTIKVVDLKEFLSKVIDKKEINAWYEKTHTKKRTKC